MILNNGKQHERNRLLYEFLVVNNYREKQHVLFQVSLERWKINAMELDGTVI